MRGPWSGTAACGVRSRSSDSECRAADDLHVPHQSAEMKAQARVGGREAQSKHSTKTPATQDHTDSGGLAAGVNGGELLDVDSLMLCKEYVVIAGTGSSYSE